MLAQMLQRIIFEAFQNDSEGQRNVVSDEHM